MDNESPPLIPPLWGWHWRAELLETVDEILLEQYRARNRQRCAGLCWLVNRAGYSMAGQ